MRNRHMAPQDVFRSSHLGLLRLPINPVGCMPCTASDADGMDDSEQKLQTTVSAAVESGKTRLETFTMFECFFAQNSSVLYFCSCRTAPLTVGPFHFRGVHHCILVPRCPSLLLFASSESAAD